MRPFRFEIRLWNARAYRWPRRSASRESSRKRFQPGIYRSSGTDERRRNPAKDLENDPPSRAVTRHTESAIMNGEIFNENINAGTYRRYDIIARYNCLKKQT